MQIMNTFVSKIGPAGKRNRAARRKQARIVAYHTARGHKPSVTVQAHSAVNTILHNIKKHRQAVGVPTDDVCNEDFGLAGTKPGVLDVTAVAKIQETVDLSGKWDESLARKALEMFAESGKSQRAFAAEHNFSESRLRDWKKKLTVSA